MTPLSKQRRAPVTSRTPGRPRCIPDTHTTPHLPTRRLLTLPTPASSRTKSRAPAIGLRIFLPRHALGAPVCLRPVASRPPLSSRVRSPRTAAPHPLSVFRACSASVSQGVVVTCSETRCAGLAFTTELTALTPPSATRLTCSAHWARQAGATQRTARSSRFGGFTTRDGYRHGGGDSADAARTQARSRCRAARAFPEYHAEHHFVHAQSCPIRGSPRRSATGRTATSSSCAPVLGGRRLRHAADERRPAESGSLLSPQPRPASASVFRHRTPSRRRRSLCSATRPA